MTVRHAPDSHYLRCLLMHYGLAQLIIGAAAKRAVHMPKVELGPGLALLGAGCCQVGVDEAASMLDFELCDLAVQLP